MRMSLRTTGAPVLLVALALLLALAAAACSSSTPTPAPTQPGQGGTTQAPAEVTRYIMNGGNPFWDWYIAVVRRIMEEQSSMTKVEVQAVGRTPEILAQLQSSPQLLPRMMMSISEAEWGLGQVGLWPPEGSYDPGGSWPFGFGQYPASQRIIMTLDPNIKTIYDLNGKTVADPASRKDVSYILWSEIFKEAGVEPRWTIMPVSDAQPALEAGSLDSRTSGIIYETTWAAGGNLELARQRPVYIVHVPEEIIRRVAERMGWEHFLFPVNIYADKVKQASGFTHDWTHKAVNNGEYVTTLSGISVMWSWHESADEEKVYHFTKTFLENLDYFEGVYPGSLELYKQRVGHAYVPQDAFHPGARRAYEELGVGYGLPGIEAWRATQQ